MAKNKNNEAEKTSSKREKAIKHVINRCPLVNDIKDGEYFGTIKDVKYLSSDNGDSVQIQIALDESTKVFSTRFFLPLPHYSALNELLDALAAESDDFDNDSVPCEDLVGIGVWFKVVHREKNGTSYCNIQSMLPTTDESETEAYADYEDYEDDDDDDDDDELDD